MARNTTTSQYLSGSITLPSVFTLFMRLSAPQTSSTAIAFETHSGQTSLFGLTSGELRFYRGFSTTQGKWSAGSPTWASENWLAIRHDGTTAAPTIRLNGSNRTVTQTQAPSGTATSTAATAYVLNGNTGTNPWTAAGGYGCDYVIYNRVLSDSECDSLGNGFLIQNGLTYGWQVAGTASPEPPFAGGVSLTVTGATFADDPAVVMGGPPQVTGLTATPSGTTMALAWTALADALSYRVQRSPDGTTWTTLTFAQFTNSYSDTGLSNGTYQYRVAGNNQIGTGTNSSTASGTISSGGTVPTAPSGLSATAASSTQINLSWTDNATDETAYTVERSPNGTSSWTVLTSSLAANTTTYSDTGLTASTTYYYRVKATNGTGSSSYSNTANATTSAGGTGAWHVTTATRPLLDRIRRVTIAASAGEGYVSTSKDGSTWSYFAGPLTGSTLAAAASQAAAAAAPVALPTNGYWDLPSITECRFIRLHHRGSGSAYTLYEFYPRRLLQSDDIEAEAIKAVHIASGAITADKIDALAINGMTITGATVRTAGSGERIVMNASNLTSYNSSNVAQITMAGGNGGKLTAGGGALALDANGIAFDNTTLSVPDGFIPPSLTPTTAYRVVVSGADVSQLTGFVTTPTFGLSTATTVLRTPAAANQSTTRIEAVSGATSPSSATVLLSAQAQGLEAFVAASVGRTGGTGISTNCRLTVSGGLNVDTTGAATGEVKAATGTFSGGLNLGSATGAGTGQIATSGNIGAGAAPLSNTRFYSKGAGTTNASIHFYAVNSTNPISTPDFQVNCDGTGTLRSASWTYTSDARVKKNTRKYDKAKAATAALKAIEIEQFDYIDGATQQVGYIANALKEVLPDAVVALEDGTLAVRSLEPWIVLWLQQVVATVEALQSDVQALKTKIKP